MKVSKTIKKNKIIGLIGIGLLSAGMATTIPYHADISLNGIAIEQNNASALSVGGRTFPYCSKAQVIKKDKYTTTYRLYYSKDNLNSLKNTIVGLAGVFGPGTKAVKAAASIGGANFNAKNGVVVVVKYPNSLKGAGVVLSANKWN